MSPRLFIGFDLPSELIALLGDAASAIVKVDPRWHNEKWVAPENLHVTARFVGEVPAALIGELIEAVSGACAAIEPFSLEVTGVVARPDSDRARMLWIALSDPSGRADVLSRALHAATDPCGSAGPPVRPYEPHITLCRARRPRPVRHAALATANAALADFETTMSVACATVFLSRLTPAGPFYERIATCALRGG